MRLPTCLAITALLAGCAAPVPGIGAAPAVLPSAAPSAEVAIASAAPTAPAASPAAPTGRTLDGTASYFGAPFAGAQIKVVPFGRAEVVATATTGPDGRFTIALPDALPAGALLKVVATRDGVSIASAGLVPAARQLQQADDMVARIVIDEARSLVYFVLEPRLEALARMATAPGTFDLTIGREAFDVFVAATREFAIGAGLDAAAYQRQSDGILDAFGHVVHSTSIADAIAALMPDAEVPALEQQAAALAALIRAQVEAGKPQPDADLIGAIPVGDDDTLPPVFGDGEGGEGPATGGSGGSSGSSGGGGSGGDGADDDDDEPSGDSGSLAITDGELVEQVSAVSIEIGPAE